VAFWPVQHVLARAAGKCDRNRKLTHLFTPSKDASCNKEQTNATEVENNYRCFDGRNGVVRSFEAEPSASVKTFVKIHTEEAKMWKVRVTSHRRVGRRCTFCFGTGLSSILNELSLLHLISRIIKHTEDFTGLLPMRTSRLSLRSDLTSHCYVHIIDENRCCGISRPSLFPRNIGIRSWPSLQVEQSTSGGKHSQKVHLRSRIRSSAGEVLNPGILSPWQSEDGLGQVGGNVTYI